MNKAVPWNIKGVGFDTREAARLAARRVGMPVGQWLDSVIAERAADLGVRVEDIDPGNRLEALTARLAELAESAAEEAEPPKPMRAEAATPADGKTAVEPTPLASVSEEDRSPARPSLHGRESLPAAPILEDRSLMIAEKASGAPMPRGGLDTVAERLSDLETRIAERDAEITQRPVLSAVSRLESRVEHLARRNGDAGRIETVVRELDGRLTALSQQLQDSIGAPATRTQAEIQRIDSKLASILTRLDAGPVSTSPKGKSAQKDSSGFESDMEPVGDKSTTPRLRDAVASISRRQADLEPAASPRTALLGETSYPSIGQAQRARRSVSPARTANVRLDEFGPGKGQDKLQGSRGQPVSADPGIEGGMDDAFRSLSNRLEVRVVQAAKSRENDRPENRTQFTSLQSEIAALGERMELMQRASSRPQDQARTARALDELRKEFASLVTGVADLSSKSPDADLVEAVRDLAGRVELSRLDGVEARVLQPIEKLGSDLREVLHALDPRAGVEGLDRQLKAIARKLDGTDPRTVDETALAPLKEQMQELRGALTEMSKAPVFAQRMERELGKLGLHLERLADAPAGLHASDLDRAVAEIRTLIERSAPEALFDRLDRKMEDLADRVDEAANRQPQTALLQRLSRQIEDSHESLAARLSAQPEGTLDLRPLESMIGGLTGKIDHLNTTSSELRTLDSLIRGLMLQIEEARKPTADAKALDALESHVGRLAERLDRSDANLAALSTIERMVGDLFQQLEETRNVAIDAAEHAARTAAQDTLRAALHGPAGTGGERSLAAGSVAVEQVAQELSAFRKAQDASEKRVNGTLAALSSTLERLVDRMIIDMQSRPPKTRSAEAAETSAATPLPVSAPRIERKDDRRDAGIRTDREDDIRDKEADIARALDDLESDAGFQPIRSKAPPVEIERAPTVDVTPDVAPLIAAARRAAQAAQASATAAARPKVEPIRERVAAPAATAPRTFMAQKRRPLLLGLAGVVLLLGALQIAKLSTVFRGDTAGIGNVAPLASDTSGAKSDLSVDAPGKPGPAAQTAVADGLSGGDTTGAVATIPAPSVPAKIAAADSLSTAPPATALAPDPALNGLGAGLRDLAMRGDAPAQYEVAVRLAEGRGVTRDMKISASWFEKAAKQGLAPAQYRLGSMYEKGMGVPTDAALAMSWYEKAAAQGNSRAMHNLAVMSADGSGGKPDYTKAATWFGKAANYGVRDSQFNLAILYARGLGVPQSITQSYEWFAIAAAQGDADAGRKRDEIGAKLDAKAQAEAKIFIDGFKPATTDRAANEVPAPPGGWDAAAPAKSQPGAAREIKPRVNNT